MPRTLPKNDAAQPLPAKPLPIRDQNLDPEFSEDSLIERASANEPIELHAATAEELAAQRTKDLEALPLIPAETATLDGVARARRRGPKRSRNLARRARKKSKTEPARPCSISRRSRVHASAWENNRVASITITAATPIDQVAAAKQLDLEKIRSVTIYDDQALDWPGLRRDRRAVELWQRRQVVEQILLEPITPDTFLLRAEETLLTEPRLALLDIESVLVNEPRHARANWLKARLLGSLGH